MGGVGHAVLLQHGLDVSVVVARFQFGQRADDLAVQALKLDRLPHKLLALVDFGTCCAIAIAQRARPLNARFSFIWT